MNNFRIVELSFDLFPGKEEYNLQLKNRPVVDMLPHYVDKVPLNEWYIMSEVEMWSHVGTHIEVPFHNVKDGMDCADIPLENVTGYGSLVDFTDKPLFEPILQEEIQARGTNICDGDIVFVRTGLDHFYRTERSHDRPYFDKGAIEWLVFEKKIACLGVDCSGIEKRDEPEQPNHKILFNNGIPLIEHLTNLDKLNSIRFYIIAVPLRIHGLDACPISVLALEPIENNI